MRPLPHLSFALFLAGCGQSGPALPPDAVILPGSTVAEMVRQCSRSAPSPGETTWQPDAADVAALERALPAALQPRRALNLRREVGEPDWSRFPDGWRRQYIGLVRGGRRFVYGNFFLIDRGEETPADAEWRRRPLRICDGGAHFFGVEYDVAGRRFTHLAFNGAL
jgi:hypothetical protein